MMLKGAVLVAIVSLLGCEIEHKIEGGADYDISGEIISEPITISLDSTRIKQVNGILYISAISLDGYHCISIDSSTLYSDDWETLEDFDEFRATHYTSAEVINCEL